VLLVFVGGHLDVSFWTVSDGVEKKSIVEKNGLEELPIHVHVACLLYIKVPLINE
jgi:hypothetical protein